MKFNIYPSIIDSRVGVGPSQLGASRVWHSFLELADNDFVSFLFLAQFHYFCLQSFDHVVEVGGVEVLEFFDLPLHGLVDRVVFLDLEGELFIHAVNLLFPRRQFFAKFQKFEGGIDVSVAAVVFLKEFGQFQLKLKHLSVVLLQLSLQLEVLVVESPVNCLRRRTALPLHEFPMDSHQRTVGKEAVRHFCQFAQVVPGLFETALEFVIRVLLSVLSGLRQFFEDDCGEFEQWFAAGEQSDDIFDVGLNGEHSCHLAVLGRPSVQLKEECIFLGIEVASAIEEREIVGEQLVCLSYQCLKSGIDFSLQTHFNYNPPTTHPLHSMNYGLSGQREGRVCCLGIIVTQGQIEYLNSHFITGMTDRRLWTAEEDEVILALIEQYGTAQWTTIAIQMRALVPHPRSSKQIRERWYNQLSPAITKAPWTPLEEEALFAAHAKLGNRWKEIAREMPGRTDNSVKNHFYSTVRRALRRLDKHFGFRDSTKKMRGLKPAALTLLLETARSLPDYSSMMELLLQFAQWKPSRAGKEAELGNGREVYENIIALINNYNKNYRRGSSRGKETPSIDPQIPQVSSLEADIDNFSTLSDGEASEDDEMSNYFGSVAETRSWFNANQKQWGVKGCLPILCDEDHFQ